MSPHKRYDTDITVDFTDRITTEFFGESLPALMFWKARVGIWTLLRALQDHRDEVIIPAYTCEMVPIAVRYAGLKCKYADVSSDSYNVSAENVRRLLTDNVRAIVLQHTYGMINQCHLDLSGELKELDIAVIHDCCHVMFPRRLDEQLTTDAAFFSTQWNKPFSTGLGGVVVTKNETLFEKLEEVVSGFSERYDKSNARSLQMQILLYKTLVTPATRAVIAGIYRMAQRAGIIKGTNSKNEYELEMPDDYLGRGLNIQALAGNRNLRKWKSDYRHRQELTAYYLHELNLLGVKVKGTSESFAGPMWVVPLEVGNKASILKTTLAKSLPIGTWFDRLPVHINPGTSANYGYIPGSCRNAETVFENEIHLITAPWVSEKRAKRAIALLKKKAKFI
jgi:perosamine synthetase